MLHLKLVMYNKRCKMWLKHRANQSQRTSSSALCEHHRFCHFLIVLLSLFCPARQPSTRVDHCTTIISPSLISLHSQSLSRVLNMDPSMDVGSAHEPSKSCIPARSDLTGLYHLGRTLGRGHYAVVKLARQINTGQLVAVKMIDKTKLDVMATSHLLQEVR